MFKFDKYQNIYITRGDSAQFSVMIMCRNSIPPKIYELQDNDELTLTVRDNITNQMVLTKTIVGANTFVLNPEDTKSINSTTCFYDVQLKCSLGIYTIIPPSMFYVEGEVTYD